jgi:spore maturation protein CgeB
VIPIRAKESRNPRFIFGDNPPANPIAHDEQLRVLYLPIFEPGQAYQYEQKRGLRDAFARIGIVAEYDYVGQYNKRVDIHKEITELARAYKPHLIFTQIHAMDTWSVETVKQLRAENPNSLLINWNGDYWPRVYLEPEYMQCLQWYDLCLTVNTNVVEEYAANGITSGYWQCASEEPTQEPRFSSSHDIVYMGNANCQERWDLIEALKATGYNVGVYGSGWTPELTSGNTHYDFATSHEIVRNAKICIGDNQYNDNSAFVSNRIWETMYPGGFMLHQRVDGLQKATGLRNGLHYVVYDDLPDMLEKIHHYMQHEDERITIAERGMKYVRKKHTFDARLKSLFEDMLPELIRDYAPT